jgi:hypothetical protein
VTGRQIFARFHSRYFSRHPPMTMRQGSYVVLIRSAAGFGIERRAGEI